jgi:hypothetical protein
MSEGFWLFAGEGACAPRKLDFEKAFSKSMVLERGFVKRSFDFAQDFAWRLERSPHRGKTGRAGGPDDDARTAQDVLFRAVSERDFY